MFYARLPLVIAIWSPLPYLGRRKSIMLPDGNSITKFKLPHNAMMEEVARRPRLMISPWCAAAFDQLLPNILMAEQAAGDPILDCKAIEGQVNHYLTFQSSLFSLLRCRNSRNDRQWTTRFIVVACRANRLPLARWRNKLHVCSNFACSILKPNIIQHQIRCLIRITSPKFVIDLSEWGILNNTMWSRLLYCFTSWSICRQF